MVSSASLGFPIHGSIDTFPYIPYNLYLSSLLDAVSGMMASSNDDIDYEGIGEDRSIRVGSDRCFRDYSPGDTVLSLSDDGRAM